ncbi:MAG: hypothetical protein V3U16_00635 [Candidatus Neomarinimicrobiota bacterium]
MRSRLMKDSIMQPRAGRTRYWVCAAIILLGIGLIAGSNSAFAGATITPLEGSIAPITGRTTIFDDLRNGSLCTKEEEDAEFQRMLELYTNDVNNARAPDGGNYQAGDDPGYSDPGLGLHKVGNCADWAQVSWSALVTRTWICWRVQKIRARQHWSLFSYHHFVRLEAKSSGRVIFLDPWKSGNPDWWEANDFPFPDGNGWAHTPTLTHKAGDKPRDPGND